MAKKTNREKRGEEKQNSHVNVCTRIHLKQIWNWTKYI